MKTLKKLYILAVFLILMPFSLGKIDILIPEKSQYNLGDKIQVSVSIIETQNHNGFLKLKSNCESFELLYYTAPISLEENFRTQVQTPELTIFDSMLGTCKIIAELEDTYGNTISKSSSQTFIVSDNLNLTTPDTMESIPYSKINLQGSIKKLNNDALDQGEIKISFMNKEYNTTIAFGNFLYTLDLGQDLDIGKYKILVKAMDKYKNYADKIIQLNILPIPTSIENLLQAESIKPGGSIKIRIILQDHKQRPMDGNISVRLFSPDNKLLVAKDVKSLDWINYEFPAESPPGKYKLISSAKDITRESSFILETVKQISMKYDNESLIVQNTGNVLYDEEVTIMLENLDKKYLVNKKIFLQPLETIKIDLTKEVPAGKYDIILPENRAKQDQVIIETSPSTTSNIISQENQNSNNQDDTQSDDRSAIQNTETPSDEETISSTAESKFTNTYQPENSNEEIKKIAEDVPITDNRPFYKKIGSGLALMSGALVKTKGYIGSRPILASVIFILLIISIILYYGRNLIFKPKNEREKNQKIQKKDEDIDKIFNDYEFKK